MGGIYHKGQPYSGQMVVDTDLSKVSNNPLKNRAITGLVDDVIAPVEGANASQAYAAGDELILNNLLYKAKSAITQNTPFDAGSSGNIEPAGTIVSQINEIFADEIKLKLAGTITSPNTLAGADDGTIGLKYFWCGPNISDSPINANHYLINIRASSDNCAQIVIHNNVSSIYIRRKYSSTWDTAWKQIYGHVGTIYSYNIGSSAESFTSGTPKTYTINTTVPAGTYMVSFETVAEVNLNEAYSNLEIAINGTTHRYYKGSCLGGAFPNVCVANQSISIKITPQRTGDTYFYITVKLLRIQ